MGIMMKYTLNNGIVLHEVKNPTGGVSWYADGGPEGSVLVWDESMIPLEVLAFILYQKLDHKPVPPPVPTPPTLRP